MIMVSGQGYERDGPVAQGAEDGVEGLGAENAFLVPEVAEENDARASTRCLIVHALEHLAPHVRRNTKRLKWRDGFD